MCENALMMAIQHRAPPRGLIHHSDRGAQYACGPYRKILDRHGIRASMSRKGDCYDNAPMESFFSSLKTELVHRTQFRTRREAKAALFEYIEIFYNRRRRHSGVGYRTPAQAHAEIAHESRRMTDVAPGPVWRGKVNGHRRACSAHMGSCHWTLLRTLGWAALDHRHRSSESR